MQRRLLITYTVLIVFSCLATAYSALQTSQKYYTNRLNHELSVQGKLLTDLFINEFKSVEEMDFQNFAIEYGKSVNARLTIIDQNGKVLGDSESSPEIMENHINRPEIIKALQNEIGFSKRYSETLGVHLIYIACPIKTKDFTGVLRLSVPLVEIQEMNRTIADYSMIGILFGVIIAIIAAFIFSKKFSRPIRQLVYAAEEIAKGNYNKKVYVDGDEEIEKLATSFNYMAKELKYSIFQLKHKNIQLESIMNSMINGIIAVDSGLHIMLMNPVAYKIFSVKEDYVYGKLFYEVVRNSKILEALERSVQNQESIVDELELDEQTKILRIYTSPITLTEQGERIIGTLLVIQDITQIRKLEQMRSDFVSSVSHELKTPLTSIRGFVDTLKNGALENQKVAERFLDIIDIETERLYRLIQDILSLSEIETREVDIDMSMQDMNELIDEVFAILRPKAEEKGIALEKDIEDRIFFYCNADRMKQILINLIDNGIKYTEKGKVKLICKTEQDTLKVIVEDTGIGISKEHIPRLFERFYRVDKGRSRKMGGTGLGLSIVKHIVKLYDGTIEVNSKEGVGSIFTVTLPRIKN